ncbi:Hypothetical predicted protein [Cloeon dipterum]|uniref:Uncharacterized protein n=1 Tax=Cloeon dipterum TaxID=197152 RepID=A0A8S1BVA8_9INSE|nr:Hypothetical predicted protein [Cloeon dipterum]
MNYQDLQREFNYIFDYNFDPFVCGLMISYIHPTIQVLSEEQFNDLHADMHSWIHAFHCYAYIWVGGQVIVEAKNRGFITAIQQGVLNLARMGNAFKFLGLTMSDELIEVTYDKFKEKDTGALSLNGFITICLLFATEQPPRQHLRRSDECAILPKWTSKEEAFCE